MEVLVLLSFLAIAISMLALWTVTTALKRITESVEIMIKSGTNGVKIKVVKLDHKQKDINAQIRKIEAASRTAISELRQSNKTQEAELKEIRSWIKSFDDNERPRRRA